MPRHKGLLLFLSLHIKGVVKEVGNRHNVKPRQHAYITDDATSARQWGTMGKCPLGITYRVNATGITCRVNAIRESGEGLIKRLGVRSLDEAAPAAGD